jgi:adenosylhomocysteine nucleosidase
MNKLGIIGAMEQEIETLLEHMENKICSHRAGSVFYEGKLSGLDVVVVQCGIGKVNAALCTQILCDCFAVTHIVNTGIAGSLCAELDIGDLVISQDAMYHDFDCCAFGYPAGKVPGMDVVAFPADEELIRLGYQAAEAVNAGHTKIGRVASGDQFVADAALKNRIIEITQALCTEMEGAAIAQTAYRNKVPFVIIRAISDKADNSADMDYPTFERIAAHRCAAVTMAVTTALAVNNGLT